MKKAFGWSITVIGAVCIFVMVGIFIGRRSMDAPINTNQATQAITDVQESFISAGKININTADASLLQQLPGIGEVLAQRIISYRNAHGNFTDIRELTRVDGIGDGKMMDILHLICIEDE